MTIIKGLMDKVRIHAMRCIVRLDALDDFALKREHNFSALAKFMGFYELYKDNEYYVKSAQNAPFALTPLNSCHRL